MNDVNFKFDCLIFLFCFPSSSSSFVCDKKKTKIIDDDDDDEFCEWNDFLWCLMAIDLGHYSLIFAYRKINNIQIHKLVIKMKNISDPPLSFISEKKILDIHPFKLSKWKLIESKKQKQIDRKKNCHCQYIIFTE